MRFHIFRNNCWQRYSKQLLTALQWLHCPHCPQVSPKLLFSKFKNTWQTPFAAIHFSFLLLFPTSQCFTGGSTSFLLWIRIDVSSLLLMCLALLCSQRWRSRKIEIQNRQVQTQVQVYRIVLSLISPPPPTDLRSREAWGFNEIDGSGFSLWDHMSLPDKSS